MSLGKCICHTAAEDELVNLAEKVLDDTDLGGNLGTAHNGDERTFDVAEDIVHSLHLFLHEETEHTVLRFEVICNDSCRSVFAVSCTESIHYPAVSVRSKFLGKLFLRSLHCLLSLFISRILLVDSYRLAFLFRIETEVLEKKHLTRFEGCSLLVSLLAVRSELYRNAEFLAYCINYLRKRKFRFNFSLRFAHVGHDDKRTTFLKNEFKCRERTTDTGVICNLAILDRNVEIHSHDSFLTFEVVRLNV